MTKDWSTILNHQLSYLSASTALVAAVAFTGSAIGVEPAFKDAEVVEFESAPYTYPPSPLKVKQAKKLGIPVEVKTEPGVSLTGYIEKPSGDHPRAAIVFLHTCAGISQHEAMWSRRLVSWGYVVLSVDSFKPRGFDYICDGRIGGGATTTPWRRALDAYGAKRYLSTLSFVDPARIGVMGLSHGGMTVLEIIKLSTSEGLAVEPFRAAIAFYPLCSEPERINTPTLILTGSKDSWSPADLCAQFIEKLEPQHEVTLEVIEDAHHGFDHPGIDIIELGYIVRSNPKAAARASQMSREFLDERL